MIYGRVKSLRFGKEKILKLKKTKGGYLQVLLYKNNKSRMFSIHRIVAQTFISNKENKPEVNHINGIKTDNSIKNLEWVTGSENKKHAYKTGLRGTSEKTRKRCIENGKKACKPIIQYDFQGNLIKEWESQTEASKQLKIGRATIGHCLANRIKTAGGYIWKFKKILKENKDK